MTAYDPESREPGLAAERTDLAWSRSGLSLVAFGAVVLRGIGRQPLLHGNRVNGACVLVLGVASMALGWWSARHAQARGADPATAADLLPISLGVAAVGLAAFALATFG